MNVDLENAKKLLEDGDYTCVLCKGDIVRVSSLHGIRPLLAWIRDETDYRGFAAADQIVGRAAAFLYMKLGITSLHANILSEKGKLLLEEKQIPFTFDQITEQIQNRKGDGMCPMEQTVLNIYDMDEAVEALERKVKELSGGAPRA